MKLAIIGASGRMGRELIRAVAARENVALSGALDKAGSPYIGRDAGELAGCGALGVKIVDSPAAAFAEAEAILDFTAPVASVDCADYAAARGLIHIIGTTGFSPAQEAHIARCAEKTAIVKSGNMSLGVNLLAALTEQAAKALGESFDIEILEMHHRHKKDAPSGTALLLAESAAKGRAMAGRKYCIKSEAEGRSGERAQGDIGFASLRGGTVIGEHSVIFAGNGERIILSHKAEERGIFAAGAIEAALWAKAKPHGLYSMRDVLGLGGKTA